MSHLVVCGRLLLLLFWVFMIVMTCCVYLLGWCLHLCFVTSCCVYLLTVIDFGGFALLMILGYLISVLLGFILPWVPSLRFGFIACLLVSGYMCCLVLLFVVCLSLGVDFWIWYIEVVVFCAAFGCFATDLLLLIYIRCGCDICLWALF